MRAWVTLTFQQTPITQIIGITDSRNAPSRKLLQALGMAWLRTDEREFKGELCLEETYALTVAQWRNQQPHTAL